MSAALNNPEPSQEAPVESAAREIVWEDFRDHLATAEKDGRRRWVYPKMVKGRWYRWRTYFSWVLLGLMFIGPFVKIGGNPLLMFNIVERKFSIAGQMFYPQDSVIFAVAMLLFLTSIIVFTTAFGRLWCGWACPQTVIMEMLFRKIEYLIEGDASAQRALNASAWNRAKLLKKGVKHAIFFGLSFCIGNWLLSYIIGIESLIQIVVDDPREHLTGLFFMMLFTIVFYLIFARFREQACTFICPYGRFQSAMVDENTMVVAYDHKRGEKRAQLHRNQSHANRLAEGFGDCVNCRQCVAVCPTGIDIRNGTQMECVNCTACIDACDAVMDKIKRPRGLIRYASLNSIESGKPFRFTARMAWYAVVVTVLAAALGVLVFTRSAVETTLLRAPGALFQQTGEGKISNLYTLKVLNKSAHALPIEFRLENAPGTVRLMGAAALVVPRQEMAQASMLIEMNPADLAGPKTKLKIGVYSHGKRLESVNTVFAGPRSQP